MRLGRIGARPHIRPLRAEDRCGYQIVASSASSRHQQSTSSPSSSPVAAKTGASSPSPSPKRRGEPPAVPPVSGPLGPTSRTHPTSSTQPEGIRRLPLRHARRAPQSGGGTSGPLASAAQRLARHCTRPPRSVFADAQAGAPIVIGPPARLPFASSQHIPGSALLRSPVACARRRKPGESATATAPPCSLRPSAPRGSARSGTERIAPYRRDTAGFEIESNCGDA